MLEVAGFLLAGGLSTRMGRDKALLELGGKNLTEIGLQKLAPVCAEVAILSNDPSMERFGRVIPDRIPGCGPLGGLVAALESSRFRWNLVLAVDVPLLPVEALKTLLNAAAECPAMAVIAEVGGEPQPLCALYAQEALPVLRRELEAGRWKVMAAIKAAGSVEFVHFAEEAWFQNVNTPEDFAFAEKNAGARHIR